jgi:two-component system sensor histidine kinase YesM
LVVVGISSRSDYATMGSMPQGAARVRYRGGTLAMKGIMNTIRHTFHHLKIKHKVFILIGSIMAICFLITYSVLQYAYNIYDEQLYAKSSQLLNLSSSGIENELRKSERQSFSIATDSQIQSYLLGLKEDTPEYEQYRLRSYIIDKLVQYAGYEKYIDSIEVVDLLGVSSRAGVNKSTSAERQQFIIDESIKGTGETRWIYPSDTDSSLIAAREIRSYENLNLNRLGTLIIRFKFDKIVEDLLAGTDLKNGEMRISFGEHIIYPLDAKTDVYSERLLKESVAGGYFIETIKGKSYFFTHIKSGYLGWSYFSLIPFDQIFRKIVLMKNILLAGFAGSLLVVFLLAISFSRSITKPIELLIVRMKQVQLGDFSQAEPEMLEVVSLPMDEVGQLHRTYRMMIQKINELITENYAKQLVIKETQFKALQAQINPHFLYNTLESINWLAKANGEQQISRMVEALGFLLRSSISLKETLITVQEELEIVTNYLTIQKYRFEERLMFELDMPDEAKKAYLPKLTLQPLLENAVHYALETMIEPCCIRIVGTIEEDKLLIMVEDNGPGMDEELLEKVRLGVAPTRGSGIGLKNIEERIVIAFGEPYGVQIESRPGQGTQVYVAIPYTS